MDDGKNTVYKENEVVDLPKTQEEAGDKQYGEKEEKVSGSISDANVEDEKKKGEFEDLGHRVDIVDLDKDTHDDEELDNKSLESNPYVEESDVKVTESQETYEKTEDKKSEEALSKDSVDKNHVPSSSDTFKEDFQVSSEASVPKEEPQVPLSKDPFDHSKEEPHEGKPDTELKNDGESPKKEDDKGDVEDSKGDSHTEESSVGEVPPHKENGESQESHGSVESSHQDTSSTSHPSEDHEFQTKPSESEEDKNHVNGGGIQDSESEESHKPNSGYDNEDDDLDYQNYLDLVDLNKSIGEYIRRYESRAIASLPLFDITYTLERSPNVYCNIPNELILDNTGYYYKYNSENTKINGKNTKIVLNAPGSLITLNALDSDKTLSFNLSRPISNKPINLNPEAIDGCLNTQYGFKLSEVIANLGRITKIPLDSFGEDTKGARLTINQRAFLAKNKNQIIFNFYFKNKGFEHARRVLFKDILPKGVTLNLNGVYINSCLAKPEDVNIDGQKLLVRIPNIEKMSSSTLTLICSLCDNHPCGEVNIGVVSYVSKYVVKIVETDPLHINQSMSNAKSIDEVVRGCSTPIEQFKY